MKPHTLGGFDMLQRGAKPVSSTTPWIEERNPQYEPAVAVVARRS
jgi:hypothetical protein